MRGGDFGRSVDGIERVAVGVALCRGRGRRAPFNLSGRRRRRRRRQRRCKGRHGNRQEWSGGLEMRQTAALATDCRAHTCTGGWGLVVAIDSAGRAAHRSAACAASDDRPQRALSLSRHSPRAPKKKENSTRKHRTAP